jgi:uncharacterized protein (DUF2141 family)
MKKILILLTVSILFSFRSEKSGDVLVDITGINFSKKGNLVIGLFKETGFPKADQSSYGKMVAISSPTMTVKFSKITAGTYAIAVFQDKDKNGKLSTNMVGYPVELYGFSKNKFGTFGPPDFKDVSFEVKESQTSHLKIQIR